MTKKTQSRGQDTKNRILLSTINVIKNQGMRAVRHRAIAAKAGVPLGSTTYHFKSIEDLISSTFVYWHQIIDVGKNPHFISLQQALAETDVSKLETIENKQYLAEKLFQDSVLYLESQIFEYADERIVELAFHNEALRNPTLSALLLKSWDEEVALLSELFKELKVQSPEVNAEITFSIILQFEKKAMLIADKEAKLQAFENMKVILKNYIYGLLDVLEK